MTAVASGVVMVGVMVMVVLMALIVWVVVWMAGMVAVNTIVNLIVDSASDVCGSAVHMTSFRCGASDGCLCDISLTIAIYRTEATPSCDRHPPKVASPSAGRGRRNARSAVTQRVRSAIERLDQLDSKLGGHLATSVETGTFCVYRPLDGTAWHVDR